MKATNAVNRGPTSPALTSAGGHGNDDDETALVAYVDAVHEAQDMDRQAIRTAAAAEFSADRIVDVILAALDQARG